MVLEINISEFSTRFTSRAAKNLLRDGGGYGNCESGRYGRYEDAKTFSSTDPSVDGNDDSLYYPTDDVDNRSVKTLDSDHPTSPRETKNKVYEGPRFPSAAENLYYPSADDIEAVDSADCRVIKKQVYDERFCNHFEETLESEHLLSPYDDEEDLYEGIQFPSTDTLVEDDCLYYPADDLESQSLTTLDCGQQAPPTITKKQFDGRAPKYEQDYDMEMLWDPSKAKAPKEKRAKRKKHSPSQCSKRQ